MRGLAFAGAADPGRPSLEVDPEPRTVQDSVTVRLTITEPTLPG